jgi:NTP pyrophosphatase (non-canonical NTP hydrolase)
MNLNEYQELAKRTATHPDPNADMYELMALGLIGETGEVVDIIKKHKFHNVPMDVDKLKKEVGDILWYLTNALTLNQLRVGTYITGRKHMVFSTIRMAENAAEIAAGVAFDVIYKTVLQDFLEQLSMLAAAYNFTLEEAAECNIEKLKRRYPDGFDLRRAATHDSE